jgi:site-specific recombinase XerC
VPLSYWLRLRVEGSGCSVVSGLGFGGGEHAEGGVQAPMVEPVDPGHRGELDVADVLQRAGVEGAGADGLGLEQADDRLHQDVVVGVADGPDRRRDAKKRITPLDRQTIAVLRELTATVPAGGFLFPTRTGTQMSTDAVAARLALHAHTAATICPSINADAITPHVLRHTAAMRLLTAGIDTTVIALWLGHESVETTQIYLHADITTKEKALARTTPTGTRPGRYTITDDTLLAFLNSL